VIRVALPLLLLAAVVAAAVIADRPQPPADLTFINGEDPNTLDLQRMSWTQDLRLARLLSEGLTRTDPFTRDFRQEPAVAESWTVSDDGRTYIFRIRDDAKWSNGDPVTAHDFVYSWRRALLPETACKYINFFWFLEGGRAFYDWRTDALADLEERASRGQSHPGEGLELWQTTLDKFDELVGVKATGDRTLVVTLERPVPYFLELCAFPLLYPLYPPLLDRYEHPNPDTGRIESSAGWTKAGTLISNGPFILERWRFKRDMRLERNPYYWDAASINLDSISIPSITDPNAVVLAYESGGIDWSSDVTAPYRADMYARKLAFYDEHRDEYDALVAQGLDPIEIDRRLPEDPRAHIHAFPVFGTYFYNFNCSKKLSDGRPNPFADARVRRAFAMTIDKRAIVEDIKRIGEPVARTLIPPGSLGPGYHSPRGLDCISDAKNDEQREAIAQRARDLLAEAGYPDPDEFITVELVFNKDSGHDLIAQSIAKDWQRYLGVKCTLAQKELKVYRNDLIKHNFITARAGWWGDYGDPTTFLEISRSDNGNNDRNFKSPAFDAMLDDADYEPDPQKRLDMLAECERVLMEEELPMVPLYHYVQMSLFDAHHLSGPTSHPRQEQHVELFDILSDGKGADVPRSLPPLVGSAE